MLIFLLVNMLESQRNNLFKKIQSWLEESFDWCFWVYLSPNFLSKSKFWLYNIPIDRRKPILFTFVFWPAFFLIWDFSFVIGLFCYARQRGLVFSAGSTGAVWLYTQANSYRFGSIWTFRFGAGCARNDCKDCTENVHCNQFTSQVSHVASWHDQIRW